MALTNAEVLNQWLTPCRRPGIRAAAVHSPPLATRPPGADRAAHRCSTANCWSSPSTALDCARPCWTATWRASRVAAVAGESGSPNLSGQLRGRDQQDPAIRGGIAPRIPRQPRRRIDHHAARRHRGRGTGGLFADALEPVVVDLRDAMRAAGPKVGRLRDGTSGHDTLVDRARIAAAPASAPDFAPEWLVKEAYRRQARMAVWAVGGLVLPPVARSARALGGGTEPWRDPRGARRDIRLNDAQYERIARGFAPAHHTCPHQGQCGSLRKAPAAARSLQPHCWPTSAAPLETGAAIPARTPGLVAGRQRDRPSWCREIAARCRRRARRSVRDRPAARLLTGVAQGDRRAEPKLPSAPWKPLRQIARGERIDKPPIDLAVRPASPGASATPSANAAPAQHRF